MAPTLTTPDHLYTEREAAEVLGLKPSTLRTWRSTGRPGQPRHVKISARAVRYRSSDIAAYVAALTEGGEGR